MKYILLAVFLAAASAAAPLATDNTVEPRDGTTEFDPDWGF